MESRSPDRAGMEKRAGRSRSYRGWNRERGGGPAAEAGPTAKAARREGGAD
jgi:hypothetical protein